MEGAIRLAKLKEDGKTRKNRGTVEMGYKKKIVSLGICMEYLLSLWGEEDQIMIYYWGVCSYEISFLFSSVFIYKIL